MIEILFRILQLANPFDRQKISPAQIQHLAGQIITLLILSFFMATLAALSVAFALYGLYQALFSSGLNGALPALIVGLTLLIIFVIGIWRLKQSITEIRAGLHSLIPPEPPIIGKVSHVAGSFLSGLLRPNPIWRSTRKSS